MLGKGTSSDPYVIMTPDDLASLQSYYDTWNILYNDFTENCYVELGTSIDLTSYSGRDGGKGWKPYAINLCFDGKGYSISNLYINRPDESGVGLFSHNDTDNTQSYIKNLRLKNVDICGKEKVGALVSETFGSDLENIIVDGEITYTTPIDGTVFIGGVIGEISVGDTYADLTSNLIIRVIPTSIASNSEIHIGQIFGSNQASGMPMSGFRSKGRTLFINDSRTTYTLYLGGIIGSDGTGTNYSDCVSKGSIMIDSKVITSNTNFQCIGGFIGSDGAGCTFNACLANSKYDITANNLTKTGFGNINYAYFGGFIGADLAGSTLSECASIISGRLIGNNISIGSFIGCDLAGVTISDCYGIGRLECNGESGGFIGTDLVGGTYTRVISIFSGHGYSTAGGFLHDDYAGSIACTDCFWNNSLDPNVSSTYENFTTSPESFNQPITGVTPLSSSALRTVSNITNYDFDTIWQQNSRINKGFPSLRNIDYPRVDQGLVKNVIIGMAGK